MAVEVVAIPFVGGSYEATSQTISGALAQNVYPEYVQEGTAKPMALLQRPGRSVWVAGDGEGRALWKRGETLYRVRGTALESITSGGNVERLGVVDGTGRVSVADSGTDALICTDGATYRLADNVLSQVTDPDMPGGRLVTYHNGYWLKAQIGSNEFAASAIDDPGSWSALDNAFERQLPGNLTSILSDHAELLLMKSESMAFWFESGAPTGIPFDRVPQLVLQTGVLAPDSVVGSLDERVFFVGQQDGTTPMVFVLQGRQVVKISTPAVDNVLQGSPGVSSAYGWRLGWKGHFFYVLTIPGSATLVYDATTQVWHNWTRYPLPDYDVTFSASAFGQILCLGRDGSVYRLDDESNLDGSTAIVRTRQTQPFEVRGMPFALDWLELDAEVGTAALGADAKIWLELSRDRGKTWSNPRPAELGGTGGFATRVKWDKLGFGREFVARVTCSDDIRTVWTSLRAGVRLGRN